MNKPITPKEMEDWVGETWDRCQKEAWSEPMNRDDIIRMARQVRDGGHWNQLDLINFAALVAAAEREACAKVCEAEAEKWEGKDGPVCFEVRLCSDAIRARGEK